MQGKHLAIGAAVIAALVAPTASAHQNGYYSSAPSESQYWNRTPLRPYGAYDGLTIRLHAVRCKGYNRQVGGETSPPTIHRPNSTLYKHHICVGLDPASRMWSFISHARKHKSTFSYLRCVQQYSNATCPQG